MSIDTNALAGRIRETMSDLEHVVQRVEALADKVERENDDDYLDGVALNLHGFYAGVERVFEDIGRVLDESIPRGPRWHQDLLLQMAAEMPLSRPAVISTETRRCLNHYLGFRHVVRHLYTFDLRTSRIRELVADLRPCFGALTEDIENFLIFLEQMADNGE